uniref:RNB domain-containing ribonuclease n=1 Tax=Bacillus pumilus TaxID=1408 RepID=UPI001C93149C
IDKDGLGGELAEEAVEQGVERRERIDEKEVEGRGDVGKERIVRIEGADGKELDDGVRVEKLDDGKYKVGVDIGDVCDYVREKCGIDEEGYEGGRSVYVVEGVIAVIG